MDRWATWYRIDSAAGGTEEAGGGVVVGMLIVKFFLSPLCFFISQVSLLLHLVPSDDFTDACGITDSIKQASKDKTV